MDIEVDPKTNPTEHGVDNPGADEEIELRPMTSSRRGSEDTTSHPYGHRSYGESSFITGVDEHSPLIQKESKRDEAWAIIKSKYPNFNPANSSFTATMDEHDRVVVKLKRMGGKYHPLFNPDGEINSKLPTSIKVNLDQPAETNNEELGRQQEKIKEILTQMETASEERKEDLSQALDIANDTMAQLERENEEIEQRMALRDRVKAIFKKYGFTVLAVASAVGVVIGVIVANLKNGLASLGKGISGGLKTIGKKLGEILPGLVGAIASFVFRTAGEAIGFLAKNAWLLIVGVVIYLVEQFKKKK